MPRTKSLPDSIKTEYGVFTVGDKYEPADGSKYTVTIIDVREKEDVGDIIIKCPNGTLRPIDWFKFSYRYKKC